MGTTDLMMFFLSHRINAFWYSGKNASGAGASESYPHLIWYDFGASREPPIVPAEISIGVQEPVRGPTKWQFIGSATSPCDRYSDWAILCEDLSGYKFNMSTQIKSCEFDEEFGFRCLGIRILESPDDSWYGADLPYALIKDIRMWEKVV